MEPDQSATDGDPNQPRSVPPSLPVASPAGGWVVVASFPSVSAWHSANKALSRRGIAAQMRMADGNNPGVDLLVMYTEAEWARDLLARGDEGPSDAPTGGFPLHDAKVTPASQQYLRPIPVQGLGLTDAQNARYSALIVVLWVILAAIVVLMVVAMF